MNGLIRRPGELGELLRRIDSSLYLRAEVSGERVTLHNGVSDRVIGIVNLETHVVTVNVPPDMVSPLLARDLQLRGTSDGVSVRVTDLDTRNAAEALISWRTALIRFAPQLRCASP